MPVQKVNKVTDCLINPKGTETQAFLPECEESKGGGMSRAGTSTTAEPGQEVLNELERMRTVSFVT